MPDTVNLYFMSSSCKSRIYSVYVPIKDTTRPKNLTDVFMNMNIFFKKFKYNNMLHKCEYPHTEQTILTVGCYLYGPLYAIINQKDIKHKGDGHTTHVGAAEGHSWGRGGGLQTPGHPTYFSIEHNLNQTHPQYLTCTNLNVMYYNHKLQPPTKWSLWQWWKHLKVGLCLWVRQEENNNQVLT